MAKTKSILKKSKGKKHAKRVHFKKSKKGKKVKTMKGKKHMKNIRKKNKKKTRKYKKNNGKRSMRRKLKIKMKGGSGIGAKLTGVAYNSDPQQQYPESTNLNSIKSDGLNEDIMTKHLLKLNGIEDQFRELTNKFEEVNFKLDKLSTRVTKIQSDSQFHIY